MTTTVLNRASLPQIADPVRRPSYDPAGIQPGIVHLGTGGFHRAHMARYTHALMEMQPEARRFGIVGSGLLPADRALHDALMAQDRLYTLVEREGSEETATIIGSLAGMVYAGEDTTDLLAAIDDPRIAIVSLTVTENGYCMNPATKKLDPEHRSIRADLAQPARPVSAVGVLVEALRRRRDAGQKSFTVLTCDNIQNNGHVVQRVVLDLARLRDPALADWIEANTAFPNTMVDRITPRPSAQDRAAVEARYGYADACPVVCEPFTQWIVEDHFVAGRPAWELVGAQFVPDVAPYEAMKLRLLNASHLAVAGLGRLAGMTYVDETMREPVLHAYMAALMDRETGPTVPPLPDVDLPAYKRMLLQRFGNPAIKDTVDRVNNDAPLNLLIDPIASRLEQGGDVELLALALAAWMRRVRGADESGQPIPISHPLAALLQQKAVEGGPDPAALLSIDALFGRVSHDPRLLAPLGRWLASLYERGSIATLHQAQAQLSF